MGPGPASFPESRERRRGEVVRKGHPQWCPLLLEPKGEQHDMCPLPPPPLLGQAVSQMSNNPSCREIQLELELCGAEEPNILGQGESMEKAQ